MRGAQAPLLVASLMTFTVVGSPGAGARSASAPPDRHASVASAARTGDLVTPVQARASQWYLAKLGVTAAHKVTTGEGVTVCVIDNGVNIKHRVFQGAKTAPGIDFSDTGSPDGLSPVGHQDVTHGTGMAGLIVGQGEGPTAQVGRAQGVLGVAPGATLMSMAIGDDNKKNGGFPAAVKECADRGAKVISMSFLNGFGTEAIRYAQARDVVLVGGAPNTPIFDKGIGVPAGYMGVVGVSGVDSSLRLDPNSAASGSVVEFPELPGPFELKDYNGGTSITAPHSTSNSKGISVGYAAPEGVDRYRIVQGNSGATAITAGAVALIRAAHPDLNAANVINRLLMTAKPPTDGSAAPSNRYGWGVLDVAKAVTAEVPLVEHNPLGSEYTQSGGVRLPQFPPQRPEPPAGAILPPAPVDAEITATPTAPGPSPSGDASTAAASPPAEDTSTPAPSGAPSWLLPVVGLALLAGATAYLLMRRGRTKGMDRGEIPR